MNIRVVKVILIACFSILFFSCLHKENSISRLNNSSNILILIDGEEICSETIDSMARMEIYNIRKQKIEEYISEVILAKEASIYNMTREEYIMKHINERILKNKTEDVTKFVEINPTFANKIDEVEKILYNIKRKDVLRKHIDSLSTIYNVSKRLKPEYSRMIDVNGLIGVEMNQSTSSKDIAYLLVNFDCHTCIDFMHKLKEIIKSNKEMKFELIYLDASLELPAKAISIAVDNSIGLDLIQYMLKSPDSISCFNFYSNFFSQKQIPINNLKESLPQSLYFVKMLQNRDLLFKQNVYTTPSFILDNKLYEGSYSLDELELLFSSNNH